MIPPRKSRNHACVWPTGRIVHFFAMPFAIMPSMNATERSVLPTLAPGEGCTGCAACRAVCLKGAIAMVADGEGFLRPRVDGARCVGCHRCEQVCPVLQPGEPDVSPVCYAAYTRDEELRLKSSSGGIFTELAWPIVESGGVVFGCVLEHSRLVAIHAKAETMEDLAEMRGSKYVQSDLRDTFREARAALENGRQVLFSGTPCQIAGLNGFLGRRYDNLLTVEVVCHGVSSPAVFEAYKARLEAGGGKVVDVAFRRKNPGWREAEFRAVRADGSSLCGPYPENAYMDAFLSGLSLRPSCARCVAKAGRSGADVTLGDFWGAGVFCPDLDDNRGLSWVTLHTETGRAAWNQVSGRLISREVTVTDAMRENMCYVRSVRRPLGRRVFMRRFAGTADWERLLLRARLGVWPVRTVRLGLWHLKQRFLGGRR